jgi:uncharacterized protein YPO0396
MKHKFHLYVDPIPKNHQLISNYLLSLNSLNKKRSPKNPIKFLAIFNHSPQRTLIQLEKELNIDTINKYLYKGVNGYQRLFTIETSFFLYHEIVIFLLL